MLGNGQLQVIEGTDHNDGNPGTGSVYALDGATGAVLWKTSVVGRVVGSVVTADLSGSGHQDVLVPTGSPVRLSATWPPTRRTVALLGSRTRRS